MRPHCTWIETDLYLLKLLNCLHYHLNLNWRL